MREDKASGGINGISYNKEGLKQMRKSELQYLMSNEKLVNEALHVALGGGKCNYEY